MSIKSYQSSSAGRKIAYGVLAGIISGMVMLVTMTAFMGMLKLPPTLFPILLGTTAGQIGQAALITGIGIHFVASMAIGAIFGIVTSRITKLMINNFVQGIIFGILAGIVAFIVLFMPVSFNLLPQNMMNLINMMNPSISSQAIIAIILTGSLLSHLSYGIILGLLTITMERIRKRWDFRRYSTTKDLAASAVENG